MFIGALTVGCTPTPVVDGDFESQTNGALHPHDDMGLAPDLAGAQLTPAGGLGQPCTSDQRCTSGFVCSNEVCTTLSGATCSQIDDCAAKCGDEL
jgi:hypothetical protein